MLAEVFTNHFGYANALAAQWDNDISNSNDMKNAILSNLDAGLPVELGIGKEGQQDIGHSVIGDGYGYSDGSLYIHFNMGWSGIDDAWYAPPKMGGTQYNFDVLDGFVCNIFTNEMDRGGVICSGQVLDSSGSPIANAEVVAKRNGKVIKSAITNAKGIYSLILSPGSYVVSAFGETISVHLDSNVGTEIRTNDDESYGYYCNNQITIGNRCEQNIKIDFEKAVTSTTDVPVKFSWLAQYFPGAPVGEYESIAERDSDNDNIATWVEYVLGTDPTNIMSRFEAYITMKDGKPVVESNVYEDRLANFGYKLVKKGKSSLDPEAEWDEADFSQHRFFWLSVEKK